MGWSFATRGIPCAGRVARQGAPTAVEYVLMEAYYTYMAKLTLSVEETVVGRAKDYAAACGTSVSRLVEDYLRLIANRGQPREGKPTPVLARWRGALEGSRADRRTYRRHLEDKYL
jgi:hypothetical protein